MRKTSIQERRGVLPNAHRGGLASLISWLNVTGLRPVRSPIGVKVAKMADQCEGDCDCSGGDCQCTSDNCDNC